MSAHLSRPAATNAAGRDTVDCQTCSFVLVKDVMYARKRIVLHDAFVASHCPVTEKKKQPLNSQE